MSAESSLFLPGRIGIFTPGQVVRTPPEWTGRMVRMCLRCARPYGHTACLPEQHGKLTHGYCPACHPLELTRLMRELGLSPSNETTAMNKTLPPSAIGRAALDARRVKEALPEAHRVGIRCRAVRDVEFGTHWIWRNGAEHYTPAGLLALAEAHNREQDPAGAIICRRLAAEIAAADVVDLVASQPPTPADAPEVLTHPEADTYAELERRGLA